MKKQLFFIHGGMTFKKHEEYIEYLQNREISLEEYVSWNKKYLDKQLGNDFDVIRPRMPKSENAQYKEWAIHFECYIPLLKKDIVFVGFSLGAGFLAKWLAHNTFPKRLGGVFLVAAPYDNSLVGEDLVHGFALGGNLSNVTKQCLNTHFFFSENDDCVPLEHAEKFRKKLPKAQFHIYPDKNGHFQIETFPELIREIKRCDDMRK